VIHHVAIEVRPEDLGRMVELFELLGFARVDPPPSLAEFTWLESGGTQVHLLPSEEPTVPGEGHVAVIAPDFARTYERVEAAGFEVERRREHWGAPRAKVAAPGGHTVEVMESPPARTDD